MIIRYTQTIKWQNVILQKTVVGKKYGDIKYLISTVWFLFIPIYKHKTILTLKD